ncbi:MAG TPA: endonuclease/exonuclease/phosphatase family protein, partial [Pyrinomonadaceae bacterium]|nr:endonuclease/exonuclease/phosphatase family protein [Pyrinomonadaceae bacterium]
MSKKSLSSRIACALLLVAMSHAAATAQNRVTVMTWNVHGGNPPAAMGTGTNNCAPSSIPDPRATMAKVEQVVAQYNNKHQSAKIDVIALQEIHRDQAVKLAQLLHYPAPYFVVTAQCNKNNSQSDYGTAILTPHKTALEKYYAIHTPDADRNRATPEYARLVLI